MSSLDRSIVRSGVLTQVEIELEQRIVERVTRRRSQLCKPVPTRSGARHTPRVGAPPYGAGGQATLSKAIDSRSGYVIDTSGAGTRCHPQDRA